MTHDIRNARPSLRLAAPLTFWTSLGFAALNVGLFFALLRQPDKGGLVIESGFFTTTFWAWVFLFLAVGVLSGLALNSWKTVRQFLMLGLVVKAFFAYALILVTFQNFDAGFGITILWFFLAWVQFWTVVYFLPPIAVKDKAGVVGNE